jgi:hypothetical protein
MNLLLFSKLILIKKSSLRNNLEWRSFMISFFFTDTQQLCWRVFKNLHKLEEHRLYTIAFSFHCVNLWKNKTTKWETNLFLSTKKANSDRIIKSMPDRSCQVPSFHLSLKQNLHFFMREKEVNLMGEKNRSHPIQIPVAFFLM